MRNDEQFDSFFEVVKTAADPVKLVGKPTLPRKRKKPNYSILQYVTGYEGPESNAYHRETAYDCFKTMYFQALDAIISAINDRFEQSALKKFMNVEKPLLKAINKTYSSKELKVLEYDVRGDFDRNQLEVSFISYQQSSNSLHQSIAARFAKRFKTWMNKNVQ